ncbi:GEVED domain-containing protein [Runella sp.]|uniref:GEVED domain-containing protein n=1 Tax=Runella sp. TaxID=1960881 RepID=UPI003D10BC99
MKRTAGTLFEVILLFIIHLSAHSQSQDQSFTAWFAQARSTQQVQKSSPLTLSPKSAQTKLTVNGKNLTDQGVFYTINAATLTDLTVNPRSQLDLSLPQPDGSQVELELIRVALTTSDFKISTDRQTRLLLKMGVHYRGIVKGSKKSLVSISLFPNEMIGVISEGKRNRVLGKMKGEDLHVLYNEDLISSQLNFQCPEPTGPAAAFGTLHTKALATPAETECKVVRIYFEVDYQMYTELGANATAAANFVLGMFNQVATLYRNDNIYVQISEIKIWTSPDPYVLYNGFDDTWNNFRDHLNGNFNGDVAHLLSTKSLTGGGKGGRSQFGSVTDTCTIAGINSTLCDKSQSVSFSFIYSTYQNYPTYNWTVYVVTHEIGHNLGSPHTNNCRWPGGPIDNCNRPEGIDFCPTCVAGPTPPTNGGTIMSYCHKEFQPGISFTNGFGPLPADKIRTEIQEASSCLLTGSGAPTFLTSTNITSTSARLTWIPGVCCGNFTVEYRVGTSGSFTVADTTTALFYSLSGLLPATVCQWRVRSNCSADYSAIATFTTPVTSCLPMYTSTDCTNGSGISSFVLNQQKLSFQSDCGVGNYSVFQKVVPLLKKGDSYAFSVVPLASTTIQGAHIWIDSNKNGTFENGELVASYSPMTGNLSGNLTVPMNATSGTSYLRVRTFVTSQTPGACDLYITAGETEDYLINLVADTTHTAVSLPATPTLCVGQTLSIPFGATGSFAGGTIFTVQLSNANGSFAAPTTIGTLAGTTSGSITATIPVLPAGNGYRIRVISNSPSAGYLANNGNDLVLETCEAVVTNAPSNLSINYHSEPVHASAALDIQTSNKAFLLPRLTANQIGSIYQPTAGSIVFDNTNSCIRVYNGTDWRCLSKNSGFTGSPINPTASAKKATNTRTASASFCIPSNNIGCVDNDGINSVTINGVALSTASGCGSANGYSYYPTPILSLSKGQTYAFSLTTLGFSQGIAIWLDLNRDTTFNNPEERLYLTPSPIDGTINGSIFIPPTASLGVMRLRIRTRYNETNLNPCEAYIYGETEDYNITILDSGIYTFTDLGGTSVICLNQSINVSFSTAGTFNSGNVFSAELSNASGSFASPFVLGSVESTIATTIAGTVPANVPIGTGYRIRITSTNPVATQSYAAGDTLTVSTCIGVINQNQQGLSISYEGSDIHPSAAMELRVSNKAFLLSRLTTTQINALPSAATGLLVYNLSNNCLQVYDGSQWKCLLTESIPAPIVRAPQNTVSAGVVNQSMANFRGLILSESGAGAINPTAIAEVRGDRGVLLPRLKTLQRQALPNPTAGMLIYNTDEATLEYYDGNNWRKISK